MYGVYLKQGFYVASLRKGLKGSVGFFRIRQSRQTSENEQVAAKMQSSLESGSLVSFPPCLVVLFFMQIAESSCSLGNDSFPALVSHSGQASLAKSLLSLLVPLPFG